MRFAVRLLRLLHGRHHLLAIAVAAALAHVLLGLAPALVVRQLIRDLMATGSLTREVIVGSAGLLLAVALVRAICLYADSYLHHVAAYGMLADLRVQLYRHLQGLSHDFFNRRQTGAVVNTVVNDVDTIELFVAHSISQLVIGVFVPVGIGIVLLVLNWRLALLAVLLVPLVAAVLLGTTPLLRARFRTVREQLADLNAYIQDSLAGIQVIKAFQAEEERARAVAERSAAFERSIVRALQMGTWPTAFLEFSAGTATVLVLVIGATWVAEGQLLLADLFVFLVYLAMLYRPLVDLSHANEGLQAAMAAAERIFAVLDTEPSVPDVIAPLPRQPRAWAVEFDRVAFAYEADRPVLHDISFQIKAGHVVALVGESGAGKSTIAALLQRFYDVTAGAIRVGGYDVRTVPLPWLRDQISAVLQDVFLFHGTVRENLLMASPGASFEQVVEAARAANAHDFIMELPAGYDTLIGERGVRLSGGQKQRLSIARALLKDAPILILDEATSSVDVETEAQIQAALDRLVQQRTTLVIAHRLSTIRRAHQIIVLDRGWLVEAGSHDELMQRGGRYAALYRGQADALRWEIGPSTTHIMAPPATPVAD